MIKSLVENVRQLAVPMLLDNCLDQIVLVFENGGHFGDFTLIWKDVSVKTFGQNIR